VRIVVGIPGDMKGNGRTGLRLTTPGHFEAGILGMQESHRAGAGKIPQPVGYFTAVRAEKEKSWRHSPPASFSDSSRQKAIVPSAMSPWTLPPFIMLLAG
jgi:hypothetical protein